VLDRLGIICLFFSTRLSSFPEDDVWRGVFLKVGATVVPQSAQMNLCGDS